jgi:bifunctional enzyme CysN/CysC
MRPLDMRSFVVPTERTLAGYLAALERKTLLRFITCGSVDDGKSTLIGRLLYDSKMIFEDQLAALDSDSRRHGTNGAKLDFALLVDGLAAEREQGITIDVAYRYFSTERRKFIVADTPGHEQYTRNMITGASTADLAVILVDACHGVQTQTRRHSTLVSLIGIRHVVLAINKMDLVSFSQERFDRIVADYGAFAERLGLSFVPIPISARDGDNVANASPHMPWYQGKTLIGHLDTVDVEQARGAGPFRMGVQWVNRPDANFRGFCGTVASGGIRCGDVVQLLPRGQKSRVARILGPDGDIAEAVAGQAVTLTLDDEIDASRGDLFCGADSAPAVTDQVEATLVWMADSAMRPGQPYRLKIGAREVTATVSEIAHLVNVNTLEPAAASALALNEIGLCRLRLDQAIPVDHYADSIETGGFILVDRLSNATVGAGLVRAALQRSADIRWQAVDVDKRARAALKSQRPMALWFTGLSGAGKSTIANLVEKRLHAMGRHTYMLDGDNVRHGLNRDLGFTNTDRVENLRRAGEVARLMVDAGLIVMVSFISPFEAERREARALFEPGEFFEVFVDTPLDVAESRDPKQLYAKARRGELRNFTGVDSVYERPLKPEIRVDTTAMSAEAAAETIVAALTGASR